MHVLRLDAPSRLKELAGQGEELLLVLLDMNWVEIGTRGWPLFGLLHLVQAQLEADQKDGLLSSAARWQPLLTDDHMRFRNWVHNHLSHGQTPPLVDSVHFLARADPRVPEEPARDCSAAKAMGYLATALSFAQEDDMSMRGEAVEMVQTAETHVKHCAVSEPERLSMGSLLRTEWPLWWLMHQVLRLLLPQFSKGGAAVADPQKLPSSATLAPAAPLHPPTAVAAKPAEPCLDADALCELSLAARSTFHDMGAGVFVADAESLEGKLGLRAGALVQFFKGGSPVRYTSRLEMSCAGAKPSEPTWSTVHLWGKRGIALYDPEFPSPSASYAVSLSKPPALGLYIEAGSAPDAYNAEWLQAYRGAFAQLGLPVREVADPSRAEPGALYFWRINQMFGGGHMAGRPGVGAAVSEHLSQLSARGAALWPRPESMLLYQDKLMQRRLFENVGIPTPKSWEVASVGGLEQLIQSGSLAERDFPVVLKHPYAASSRAMAGCATLAEAMQLIPRWLAEHGVPCLVQHRLRVDRDLRLTFVGGEIIHAYWRLKRSVDELTSSTGIGGSTLDFSVPRAELTPFIREFVARTGVDIGGMDVAFTEKGEPVVFEVSPIFDLNPEPPSEWAGRPYKEYKQTDDFTRRRAESYQACAAEIIRYALGRRRLLFVDIDHTVGDAQERIKRATRPSWPGGRLDAAAAFHPSELLRDAPLPGAADSLARLARDWEVSFLSARGFPGSFSPTAQWLQHHGFGYTRLILVRSAREKAAWLADETSRPLLLVDDLTRGHEKAAQPEEDEVTIRLLTQRGINFEIFRADTTPWPQLRLRLSDLAASPSPAPLGALSCQDF